MSSSPLQGERNFGLSLSLVADKFIRRKIMNFIHFFLFLIMSIMATLPVIYGRRSDSIELQNRLALFQGILGPMGLTFGLYNLSMGFGLNGVMAFVVYGVEVLLGFLLTYGLVSRYFVHRNDGDVPNNTRAQLAKYQGPLGVLGIFMCALWILEAY